MPDVVVVGGGIIGAACAVELVRRGATVTLLERQHLAAGASGRNQGWLVRPDDRVNTPLFEPSLALYRDAESRAPIAIWIDPEPVGHLSVALEGDVIDEEPPDADRVDRDEMLRLEPGLSPRAERGWFSDGGHRLDPGAATVGLALIAREAGATIRHHLPARAIAISGDRTTGAITDEGRIDADAVVVAAGPWSHSLLDPIGLRLPLTAARGWIVRLHPGGTVVRHLVERAGWRASEWRAGVAQPLSAAGYVSGGVPVAGGALLNPHPDGSVLVGSSREPAVTPEPADVAWPRRMVADAIELVPALESAEVGDAWWGVRPLSPDERPLIGPVMDGLVVATGHGSEGVILAGGTAALVAAQVLGTEPPFDPAPFDPMRFA